MSCEVLTVTLNPAIDWTVSVSEFSIGEVNRAGSEMRGAGGKGINVAALLADYGLSVAAAGFLGRENDEAFCKLFGERGIADHMVRLDGTTRMSIKIVDDAGSGTTDINFPGLSPSSHDLERFFESMRAVRAGWVVLAGSLPPGVDAGIYRDLSRRARLAGSRVALDSSGNALKLALEAPRDSLPHLVKPNLVELEEWVGAKLKSNSAILETARELVRRGVELVAVSMGREGMLLVDGEEAVWARPPDIEVGSTVGAGDALLAGLLSASKQGCTLADSAQLATAFSVEVLVQAGSYGVQPESVMQWAKQVTVQSLQSVRGSPVVTAVQEPLRASSRVSNPPLRLAETPH